MHSNHFNSGGFQNMTFFDDFSKDFEKFKLDLKEKLLDYFEENIEWMKKIGLDSFGDYNQIQKCEYTFHPYSNLILNILSGLEPNLKKGILLLLHLNHSSEPDDLSKTLELDFDILTTLETRKEEREKQQQSHLQEATLVLGESEGNASEWNENY